MKGGNWGSPGCYLGKSRPISPPGVILAWGWFWPVTPGPKSKNRQSKNFNPPTTITLPKRCPPSQIESKMKCLFSIIPGFISVMSRPKSQTKYQPVWEVDPLFKGWARPAQSMYEAFCKLCQKRIKIDTMGRAALMSHLHSKVHDQRMRAKLTSVKVFTKKDEPSNFLEHVRKPP